MLVVGLVATACIRFRAKPNQSEPAPNYGNIWLESLWTAVPVLILAVVMVFTVKTMISTSPLDDQGIPDIVVIGHQWWWEIRYRAPDGEIVTTANEVHVPVGKKLLLELRSADVIHDFWVPELGRKIDAIPGHPNHIWLRADQPRIYEGFCAEFCGASHAWMKIRVIAESDQEFSNWLRVTSSAAQLPTTENQVRGLSVFRDHTCTNCHQVAGLTPVTNEVGPILTHFASRQTLGAGVLTNTPAHLAAWLQDPDKIKPGAHMPKFGFTPAELSDLTSFLGSLR